MQSKHSLNIESLDAHIQTPELPTETRRLRQYRHCFTLLYANDIAVGQKKACCSNIDRPGLGSGLNALFEEQGLLFKIRPINWLVPVSQISAIDAFNKTYLR